LYTVIASTTNQHKFHEIKHILKLPGIRLLSLRDMDNSFDVEETGSTFKENAAIKARAYFSAFDQPVFADDSGLEVLALNNEPGVLSARYSGPDTNYERNNLLLMKKIKAIPPEERQAQFVCCVCYKDQQEELFFTGITRGIILEQLQGTGGFGYDPLFYLPELSKTFAELSTEEKNELSHRGKSIQKLREFLLKKI